MGTTADARRHAGGAAADGQSAFFPVDEESDHPYSNAKPAAPWNKGKILGQKPPLKVREIWALRVRLQLAHRARELALFNLAIDSKSRGCDLVRLRVRGVQRGR